MTTTPTPQFSDSVPEDLVRQSINGKTFMERLAAQNRLWFWALVLLRELVIEVRKQRESNELLAQATQKNAMVLACWQEIDAREGN